MYKSIAFCFILLSILHSAASSSACTANAVVIETSNQWQESHEIKRVFEVHLQNTHTECSLSDSVNIQLNIPTGSMVAYSWGMTNGEILGVSLAPGQTYSGPGFILSGPGTPTATVLSIQTCSCTNDPTLTPTNPTNVPTDAPTGAPTDAPTDAPTPGATSTPTDAPTSTPATSTPTNPPTSAPTGAPNTTNTTGTPTPTSAPVTPAPTEAPGSAGYYSLGLRVGIFTCSADDIRLSVAKLINNAVGSGYDIINFATWGAADLVLINNDGSGKYYALVATTALNACWNQGQQDQIGKYQETFNVKLVVLYAFPSVINGVQSAFGGGSSGVTVVTQDDATLNFAASLQTSTKALVFDTAIPIPGGVDPESFTIYTYPSQITNASKATPAVYINYANAQYVAAAIVQLNNPNTTRLEFYIDQADWAVYPIVLGTAWFEWVTNGLFAGSRRVEFNAHTDDIFMFTGMYDNVTGTESEDDNNRARIVPSDFEKTMAWQIATNNALPTGSNVTITFPYNYGTVKEDLGGYKKDPLFLRAMQRDVLDSFIWESHTFDHPYLDNLTFDEVTAEYTKNVPGILLLFNVTDVNDIPNYCKKSTITPSISGLFNGEAIRAILEFGFQFVVGDNSRSELIPDFLYHTLKTNATNGYDGLIIVPRHATNIYYDAAWPIHVTEQYDHQYSSKYGHSEFAQVVARDVEVAMRSLLAYRHDPFMFHQANLVWNNTAYPDGKSHCLLSYWADQVLGALKSYSSLPVISRTHDALGQVWLDRESRDACGFSGMLKFDNATRSAVGLTASATNTCVFGVSGVQAGGSNVLKYETYGPETTTWLKMTPSSNFYVEFAEPVGQI